MQPDRKTLAAIRRQLRDPDLAVALQGADAAAQHPGLLHDLLIGVSTAVPGVLSGISLAPGSELRRRVRAAHRTAVAARLLLRRDAPTLERVALDGPQPLDLLAALTGARHISLAGCPLADLGWASGLTALEELRLDSCGAPDLSALAALPALRRLGLHRMSGVVAAPLAQCPALQQIIASPPPDDLLKVLARPGLSILSAPALPPARIVNGGQICSTVDFSKDTTAQQIISDAAGVPAEEILRRMHETRWPRIFRSLDSRIKHRPLVHQLNVSRLCELPAHTVVQVLAEDNRHLLGDGEDVVDFYIALAMGGAELIQ